MENHFSEFIYETDLERAKRDFPELSDYLQETYDNTGRFGYNGQSPFKNEYGAHKAWYFPIYSALCIPAKKMLAFLELPQIYAFAVTNALLYAASLWVVLFVVPYGRLVRAVLLMLLMVNPVFFYLPWMSAEVCIASFMVMALALWAGKWYRLSAVSLSLAGTLNPAVMVLGFVMIGEYLRMQFFQKGEHEKSLEDHRIRDTLEYLACYLLSVVPFLYNYLMVGVPNLTVSNDLQHLDWKLAFWDRFLAYMVDWNLGFFPYEPVPLFFAGLFFLYSAYQKNWRYIFYVLAFLGIVAVYSVAPNICCAMSSIARYSVWALPVLLFALMAFVDEEADMSAWLAKGVLCIAAAVSVLYTGGIMVWYHVWDPGFVPDNRWTPLAAKVLEHAPEMASPCMAIFHYRTNIQTDTGIDVAEDTYRDNLGSIDAYATEEGLVRKILFPAQRIREAEDRFRGDDESSRAFLRESFAKAGTCKEKYMYLSIPPGYAVYETMESLLERTKITIAGLSAAGRFEKAEDGIVLYKDALQFGPYISLPQGKYRVSITGERVDALEPEVTFRAGKEKCPPMEMIRSDGLLEYSVSLENESYGRLLEGIEFVNRNPGDKEVVIRGISIEYEGD